MDYIIANWSDLNLIDRAWFIVGAWLFIFFMITFFFKILPTIFKSKRKDALNLENKKSDP